jgi:hypothetical protein
MALPNRMSLCPGLLWLTLNLALIIQCLSRISLFPPFDMPRKLSVESSANYIVPPPVTIETSRLPTECIHGVHVCLTTDIATVSLKEVQCVSCEVGIGF